MNRCLVAISLSATFLLGFATARASVTTPARESVATISFSDPAFRDARMEIEATQTIGAGSSGANQVVFDAAPSLESYQLSSTGAVGVTLNAFTPPSGFDLTVSASGAGSWRVTERFSASDDLFGPGPLYRYDDRNDVFVPFLNNRLPTLELTLFIGGLVDDGGQFGVGFTIPGNWSTTSGLVSSTHQYFLANLDDKWKIDTAFVYDERADMTRFHAINTAYEGIDSEHPSPFLDVYFFGSVPEPGGRVMLVSFAAIGFAVRRRFGERRFGRSCSGYQTAVVE